jgi:hypothetical protein
LGEDAVAWLEGGDTRSDLFDDPGNVIAGDVGQKVGSDDDAVVADLLVMGINWSIS